MHGSKILAMLFAIAIGFTLSSSASARDRSWNTFARESARGSSLEIDTLETFGQRLKASQLRVTAERNGIYLRRIVVTFGNNEKQVFVIDKLIDEGEQSPIVDLLGRVRGIRRVRIEYASRGNARGESVIRVEASRRPERRARDGNAHKLKVVGKAKLRRGRDSVSIPLARNNGLYSEVELRIEGYSARIKTVKVVFANGRSKRVTVNQRFSAGERAGVIAIDPARRVTEVEVLVRPKLGNRLPTLKVLARNARSRDGFSLRGTWDKVARLRLSKASGAETIRIGAGKGRFRKLVLRALRASTYVKQVVVVYGNGERERIPVYNELFAPGQSRPIRLRGNRRVSEIKITYIDSPLPDSRVRGNGRPVIEVFGETSRASPGRRPVPPTGQYKPAPRAGGDEWVLLGTHKASMFKRDIDVFSVGQNRGRFSKIRAIAKKHDVRIYGMRVTYGNGNSDSIPVYGVLADGEKSTAYDLTGKPRVIDSIAVQYQTKLNFKGAGEVELWGLKAR